MNPGNKIWKYLYRNPWENFRTHLKNLSRIILGGIHFIYEMYAGVPWRFQDRKQPLKKSLEEFWKNERMSGVISGENPWRNFQSILGRNFDELSKIFWKPLGRVYEGIFECFFLEKNYWWFHEWISGENFQKNLWSTFWMVFCSNLEIIPRTSSKEIPRQISDRTLEGIYETIHVRSSGIVLLKTKTKNFKWILGRNLERILKIPV